MGPAWERSLSPGLYGSLACGGGQLRGQRSAGRVYAEPVQGSPALTRDLPCDCRVSLSPSEGEEAAVRAGGIQWSGSVLDP